MDRIFPAAPPNGADAEAVWVPTALLPRCDVGQSATDASHINARYHVEDKTVHVHYPFGDDGMIRSLVFDRWGDPDNTGTWGLRRFGGEITGCATFDGMTIPGSGRLGWHYGTDRWSEGEFFRYHVTDLRFIHS